MQYGLLTYIENKKFFNIGDYIQSIAAKQFLPQVDIMLNREKLAEYKGEKVKLIMNGWFTHNIHNWIPNKNIIPLFVSFHINNSAANYLLNEKGIEFLKKHEPIGCRDKFTVNTLFLKGINAYFTGCLTLTLDSYKVAENERKDVVYIVDPLFGYTTNRKVFITLKIFIKSILNGKIFELGKRKRHLKKIIDRSLWQEAIHLTHEPSSNKYTDDEKFLMADDLLKKYARAKLVITSRIHCALPCLALGTPVIFINGFDSFIDTCRFDGILDLFNHVDINTKTGEFKANFPLKSKITKDISITNLEKHHEIANHLKEECKSFINNRYDN